MSAYTATNYTKCPKIELGLVSQQNLIVGQHTFFVSAVRSIRFVRSALVSELVEVFGLPSLVRSTRCLLI